LVDLIVIAILVNIASSVFFVLVQPYLEALGARSPVKVLLIGGVVILCAFGILLWERGGAWPELPEAPGLPEVPAWRSPVPMVASAFHRYVAASALEKGMFTVGFVLLGSVLVYWITQVRLAPKGRWGRWASEPYTSSDKRFIALKSALAASFRLGLVMSAVHTLMHELSPGFCIALSLHLFLCWTGPEGVNILTIPPGTVLAILVLALGATLPAF